MVHIGILHHFLGSGPGINKSQPQVPNYQINELWSNISVMLDADPHVLDWSRNRHWKNKGNWMEHLSFLIAEDGYHLTFWQTLYIVFMAQHSHVNANWVTKVYWLLIYITKFETYALVTPQKLDGCMWRWPWQLVWQIRVSWRWVWRKGRRWSWRSVKVSVKVPVTTKYGLFWNKPYFVQNKPYFIEVVTDTLTDTLTDRQPHRRPLRQPHRHKKRTPSTSPSISQSS